MDDTIEEREHQDPLSKAPGAHPLGVGVGAAVGGAAAAAAIVSGAASGTAVAGPLGAVVGAAVGAIAGGLIGKGVAEHYDPTLIEHHWRPIFDKEPYYTAGMGYEDYGPAYQLGAASRSKLKDREFAEVREALAKEYEQVRGPSRLDWVQAEPAARASWYKIYHE